MKTGERWKAAAHEIGQIATIPERMALARRNRRHRRDAVAGAGARLSRNRGAGQQLQRAYCFAAGDIAEHGTGHLEVLQRGRGPGREPPARQRYVRGWRDIDCATEMTPAFDNCYFVCNVDNGWYASGLSVVRQAMPEQPDVAGITSACRPARTTTGRAITTMALLRRPAHLGLHRHGTAPDARGRVVGKLAGTPATGPVSRLPEHRPGLGDLPRHVPRTQPEDGRHARD